MIAPSPVLEAMYQANIVASNPFSEEVYNASKYNEKIREVRLFDFSLVLLRYAD